MPKRKIPEIKATVMSNGVPVDSVTIEFDPSFARAVNDALEARRFIGNENLATSIHASKLREVTVTGIVVGTDEASVPHGLGTTPTGYQILASSSGVDVYRSRKWDKTYVYLKASAAATVDVTIKG
jgi:hypothetical protein